MFNIYFYNSYNLSASGYEILKLDYENQETTLVKSRTSEDVSAEAINYLTHGGAKMLLSKTEDNRYLYVIKGITYEDSTKKDDEMGKKWFINLAFVSDISELKTLYSFMTLALTDFAAFKKQIFELMTVSSGEMSYSIDYEKLQTFVENARSSFDNKNILSIEGSTISAPFNLAGDKFINLLKDILNVNTDEELLFVVLESDSDYFYSSYNTPKNLKPKYSFGPMEHDSAKMHKLPNKGNYSSSADYESIELSRTALYIGAGILCAGALIGIAVGVHSIFKRK